MLAGLPSWNSRVEESTRLISWGFNAWQDKKLFDAGAKVGEAQVQMGGDSSVPLVAPSNLAVSVPADLSLSNKPITMKIRYQGPLVAPIKKGDHVADLLVFTGDTSQPQVTPLVAGEDVGKAGFFTRIWLGLKSLVGMA